MYCRQFGEENRKCRIGAQLEPGVVAQKQEVASQMVHQEGTCEDQDVQVDHLDLRHLKVRALQEKHIQRKNANNDRKYVEYEWGVPAAGRPCLRIF